MSDVISDAALKDRMLFQMIQSIPVAVFVIDTDHTIVWWNRTCEDLTGIAASEVIGTRRQWEVFYPEPRPVMADLIVDQTPEAAILRSRGGQCRRSRLQKGSYEAEGFYPDVGDSGKWFFATAAPILDEKGIITGAIETVQDITWYKDAEKELQDSEARYRTLMERIVDGVLLIQGGVIRFANTTMAVTLGYAGPWEILGKRAVSIVGPGAADRFGNLITDIENRKETQTVFKGPALKKDGSEIWTESHVSVIQWQGSPAILATVKDISEKQQRALELKKEAEALKQGYDRLKSSVRDRYRLGDVIGKSMPMQGVYDRILQAAESDANTIIYGESGTGKELVARAIHDLSLRSKGEFVSVNCGAIPENLLESEFFGYCRGAFTGALHDKLGYLDIADRGSLFLDEIGEISLNLQAKLLRAIDGGGYTPVGGKTLKKPDVRIIAATNRDLPLLVRAGDMREDFYYRIHVIPIHIPPLRERGDDLILLVNHFLSRFTGDQNPKPLPGKFIDELYAHDWPGNIRELQNVLHRYVTLGQTDVGSNPVSSRAAAEASGGRIFPEERSLARLMDAYEKQVILSSLEKNRWHKGKTAAMLGINRKTLFKKIQRHGL